MRRAIAAIILFTLAAPALAQEQRTVEQALDGALTTFEEALPTLSADEFGVDVAAYRDALSLQRFQSGYWGGTITVEIERRDSATGSCGQFAAFVRIPPENGAVRLVLCPQFFSRGADALRQLTILHEMVHVVAGPDECRAMAFAARIEMAATGAFTPVDRYWRANGCEQSDYRLP